jgi:hypothetical protein
VPRIITFNIGEAFPASDPVARFVTVLAMISNDVNRSIDGLFDVGERKPDSGARKVMQFRLQAAFFYEAATFVAESSRRFGEIAGFIAGLPPEARADHERVIGGVEPKSRYYLGDWLRRHRNGTFHYSEMHRNKAAHGKEEIMQALEYAAESPGRIFSDSGDDLDNVCFDFADEVVSWWLPPIEENNATLVMLSAALSALVSFTQRACAAYLGPTPAWTITEQA